MNLIKQIDLKYFEFSSVGLICKENTPLESWLECGKVLKKIDGATKFWIGDWINFGERKYGEMYSQAIEQTDYEYKTLRNIAYVARNIELSRRRDNLSFSHHAEIADLKGEEQEKWLNEAENMTRKELRTAIKRSSMSLPKLEGESKVILSNCDFREGALEDIEANSISLIITDPPYPGEYLPLWSDLSEIAKRILKPGGFLVTYSGQAYLPEVISRLSQYLDYYWCLALYHKGVAGQRFEVNMFNRFKPILIYHKPPVIKQVNWIEDVVVSEQPDKEKHQWGQSVEPFVKLIETFSQEGDTICDPFFGGGATIEAALKTKRHIYGYEIEKEYYDLVKNRL